MQTIEKSIEVEAPLHQVYNQWTQFEEFPQFMEGVEEVRQLDDKHLHWRANIAGKRKEWDAEIVEQVPDQCVKWRSTSGAPNSGTVNFRPLDQNHTIVTLQMSYEPQGAMESMGSAMGMMSRRVESDLRHFKDFIQRRGTETGAWRGEIHGEDLKRSDNQGRGSSTGSSGSI
jgi:uncharacterized membrane protein